MKCYVLQCNRTATRTCQDGRGRKRYICDKCLAGKQPPKYGNKRVAVEGGKADSKAEAGRYQDLLLLQKAGEIRGLKLHERFSLDVNGVHICTYVADASYYDVRRELRVVEDTKGARTPMYRVKKALMLACHGITIEEVSA